ncbi:MAG TPA: ATP-grasp domain-containing protein [Xanthobacteraceae bacterium]|nr:ATP-grasp domain-containing protein [Xanthobacteraceae bacterium]
MSKAVERVLVFGDDMRIFLAVVRSLGRAGKEVHAAPFNWHSPALQSKYVSAVHYLPRYSDDPSGWRESVMSLAKKYDFDLIMPCCDDRAILPFDIHRDDFAEYRVAIPDRTSMDLLFDKQCTRELCVELDIPAAPGKQLAADDDASHLVARFGLPLVLKPRRSFWADRLDGWGKVFIVETEAHLRKLLLEIQDRPRYLVEGYFEGVGVGVSVLSDRGNILHAFQHRRLREGWGGSSSYRVSEPVNPALREACEKICRHTGLTGVCMFEFRWRPETQGWILLETNARFWGSSPLPLSLGIDFPRYLFDLLVHDRRHAPVQYPSGVRSRNAVLDGMNLFKSIGRLGSKDIGSWISEFGKFLLQPLFWLTGRERSDSFVRDDLRPAFAECAMLAKSIKEKVVRAQNVAIRRRRSERATKSAG